MYLTFRGQRYALFSVPPNVWRIFSSFFSACKYFKERFLSQSPHPCHAGWGCRLRLRRRREGWRRWWSSRRGSRWRDMWRGLCRWFRRDRRPDRRGRDDGSGRSRGRTQSLCLATRCRLWWRMCRREPRRRGLANRRGASREWPRSWLLQWSRGQHRAQSPAFRSLWVQKVLICKELKFLNVYKLGGGVDINNDLAAGLRLVVKVSLVYVFEASIIILSF